MIDNVTSQAPEAQPHVLSFPSDGGTASFVAEFEVFDFEASLRFWSDLIGFRFMFGRKGFAYLSRGSADIMIAQVSGHWQTAPLEAPLGRGVNFKFFVEDVEALADRITAAGWPFFQPLHEAWYGADGIERGYRQFLIQDPNGYLLRFARKLGSRITMRSDP